MENMITILNIISDMAIFYAIIRLFQVNADVRKLTRLIENLREDTKDTKKMHEQFITDEEHDIVSDIKTDTKMNILEYNNSILANAEEDESPVYVTDGKDDSNMKSTERGYINKNNQRNNGKTDKQGTGHLQRFYDMECLNCGHKYYANGHDIWLRKCPNCQGGRT